MSVLLRIEKLDKRHKGYGYFSHRVYVVGPKYEVIPKYMEIREWCWSTWNPSCEREMYLSLSANNYYGAPKHWAWHYEEEYNNCYIYLVSEADNVMFTLKWK